MEDQILTELEALSFKFLWKNKPDPLKRLYVILPYEKGGLNMINIGKFWESLKMSWIRRMQTSGDVWWQILQLNLLQLNCDITDLWFGGPNRFFDLRTNFRTIGGNGSGSD